MRRKEDKTFTALPSGRGPGPFSLPLWRRLPGHGSPFSHPSLKPPSPMGCCESSYLDSVSTRYDYLVSMLHVAYGKDSQQLGYTDGHSVVSKEDEEIAKETCSSLLYGEILIPGTPSRERRVRKAKS